MPTLKFPGAEIAPPAAVEVESPFAEAMREEGLNADDYDQAASLVAIDVPPVAEVRMSAPPGPVKGYRAGGTTYVGREGQTIFVPSDHRSALLKQGWADAA